MIEPVLTPAHPDPLEPLWDKPFTGTLDHATPHRQAQVLVLRLVAVLPVPMQVRIQRAQGIPCGVRHTLAIQGLD